LGTAASGFLFTAQPLLSLYTVTFEAARGWLRAFRLQEIGANALTGIAFMPCPLQEVREHPMKRNRRNTLLWMKDLLEHMSRCHDQLEWAGDGDTESFLADALLGDLNECQKLCEQLRAGQTYERRSHTLVAT
jgi:hypothetical protein